MPHITLSLSPSGPILDAFVFVSQARRQALEEAKQAIPQPVVIRALIDTGAGITCVDPSVLNTLGLSPTGSAQVNTPSTGSQPHQASLYDVALVIPTAAGVPSLVRPTLAVLECQLLQQQGFHALIGRDILSNCILTYNGASKLFMLAY